MAYSFLNTTTYTNQLAAQQRLLSQLQEAANTPLGSGFDLNSYDNDLIEIVAGESVEPQGNVPMTDDLAEQPDIDDSFLNEPEIDDRVEMDLINSMFQEETPTPRVRTRTVQPEEEEEDEGTTTYQSNGKVKPRIWQYGGSTSKYQFGGNNTLYADTYEQQRIGLNDPNYNTAVFNTKGTNTFRGLDSYEPVAVTDGSKYKVLHGPEDTAKFNGQVYEQKLKMQTGGRATRADSIALYNNSKQVADYYNSQNYKLVKQSPLGKLNDSATYYFMDFLDEEARDYNEKAPRKLSDGNQGIIPKSSYRKNVDDNRFFQREQSDAILDTRAPMQLYDRRIGPNFFNMYNNQKVGDVYQNDAVQLYTYDPIAVKPVDLLTPEEREIRAKRYGDVKSVKTGPKPLPYPNLKLNPSQVKGTSETQDIKVQGSGYKPMDLSQKPTKFSATYREGNSQKTIYFKDKESWKSFLGTGALSTTDTYETEGRASATGYRTYQFGGELREDTSEVKEFYNQYGNSPNYTKRLVEQGYTNPQQVILDRIANIKPVTTSVDNLIGSQYNAPNYTVFYNPKDAAEYGFPKQSTLAHEYGHAFGASQGKYLANPNLELNENEMNAFSSRNKLRLANTAGMTEQQKLDLEHDSRPSESKADLDALRFRLFKDKIYDTGTQEFSPELLKKAKELYKDDNIVNRLFQNYSDDDLIYLMNHVAKNDSKETAIAQTGAQITDPVEYFKSYANSQAFMNRARGDKEKMKKDALSALGNAKYYILPQNYVKPGEEYLGSRTTNPYATEQLNRIWKDKKINIPSNTGIILDPVQGAKLNPGDNIKNLPESYLYNDTYAHEAAHRLRGLVGGTDAFLILQRNTDPQALKKNFSKDFREWNKAKGYTGEFEQYLDNQQSDSHGKINNHDINPRENYADLNALRWMMYKRGIYDTRKGDMTPEQLKKAKNDPFIKKSFSNKRLFKHFKDDDIIYLNNKIAQNDNNIQSEIYG